MNWKLYLAAGLSVFLSKASYAEPDKQGMVNFFDGIVSTFQSSYAPEQVKQDQHGITIDSLAQETKTFIDNSEELSVFDYQNYLVDFFNSFKDYHVYFDLISTEKASLPFLVVPVEDKYVIAYVDRSKLSESFFPFYPGDELISLGGKPTAEIIDSLLSKVTQGQEKTAEFLAAMYVTRRSRAAGFVVPKGPTILKVKKRADQKIYSRQLTWDYSPEYINYSAKKKLRTGRGTRSSLKSIRSYRAPLAEREAADIANPYSLGNRESYLGELGNIIWESEEGSPFHAYIYEQDDGRKVSYVRISSYSERSYSLNEMAREFSNLMGLFQSESDALVIDQLNNPGGNIFYLYSLISMLTDQVILTPRQKIKLSPAEVRDCVDDLKLLEMVNTDLEAKAIIGDSLYGYPINMNFVWTFRNYCRFVIESWENQNWLTEPTHIYGVDGINPFPESEKRFTKPILVLTNELDFSGGDFFPAILQDAGRATIMGGQTAGAGGYVTRHTLSNSFGLDYFSTTGSVAYRQNGQVIEGLGITPDIKYQLTVEDIANDFVSYRSKINDAVKSILQVD